MSIKGIDQKLDACLGICFVVFALTMSSTAQTDPRVEDVRKLQENNRIMDGQQKDVAAQRTKEQRIAIVNEAFKRLQMLHNEMMAIVSSDKAVDGKKLAEIAEEVKLRSIELNANLALPQLPKEKEKDKKPTETAGPQPVSSADHMSGMCSVIRDFVKHVNLSPTDPNAGLQSRRDLLVLIEKSDKFLLSLNAPAKT